MVFILINLFEGIDGHHHWTDVRLWEKKAINDMNDNNINKITVVIPALYK